MREQRARVNQAEQRGSYAALPGCHQVGTTQCTSLQLYAALIWLAEQAYADDTIK